MSITKEWLSSKSRRAVRERMKGFSERHAQRTADRLWQNERRLQINRDKAKQEKR